MIDFTDIPPADRALRERIMRQAPHLAKVSPVARELYLTTVEWSRAHRTHGRVPKWMTGRLYSVAESRCRARGEIEDSA
jgi:hypothetical protein